MALSVVTTSCVDVNQTHFFMLTSGTGQGHLLPLNQRNQSVSGSLCNLKVLTS